MAFAIPNLPKAPGEAWLKSDSYLEKSSFVASPC
jgi:hypothetical protein